MSVDEPRIGVVASGTAEQVAEVGPLSLGALVDIGRAHHGLCIIA